MHLVSMFRGCQLGVQRLCDLGGRTSRLTSTRLYASSHEERSHFAVEETEQLPRTLNIRWKDTHLSKFHYVWLRHNCRCSQCVEPSSGQKLLVADQVPLEPRPASVSIVAPGSKGGTVRVEIRWSDDEHTSYFDASWLRAHCYSSHRDRLNLRPQRPTSRTVPPWDAVQLAAASLPVLDYGAVIGSDEGLWAWLDQLHRYGLSLIRNAPSQPNVVAALADRVAYVKETMYGRVFDVISVPKPNNVAYTSLALAMHQDLLYYEAPPGLQFLHCLKNDAIGGETMFLDGFKAAERLRRTDPSAFRVLSTTLATYHKDGLGYGHDHMMHFRRPVICLDADTDAVASLNYAPPFEGPLHVPFKQVEPFYASLRAFCQIVRDPELIVSHRWKPGDVATFNNRRVLHGRDAFDAASGARHLQGTYVELDDFFSRYQTLAARHL
eukprot:TRINITY_DN7742_c0_g1_i2.p1 TRINITY_DN7742_c0_g1~~TRINITY_DN7742_c0_g1_i2.p1  ORF type:complete len:437 (+),score=57.78 TRINITY_DN7742_c0_g1_i2:736-2046(+)